MNSKELAKDIFRCELLDKAKSNCDHPCHRVVSYQQYGTSTDRWQVPEPWRGNIEEAPLLFVSSNPSIDPLDDAPWNIETNAIIEDYYDSGVISCNFPKSTSAAGKTSNRPVAFWTALRKRAEELFKREDLTPGKDYALTEVVHCKSRGEYGVAEARKTCADRYLSRVLGISGAKVLVCFGRQAHEEVDALLPNDLARNGPIILKLPHPNARVRRTAAACLTQDELDKVHRCLSA